MKDLKDLNYDEVLKLIKTKGVGQEFLLYNKKALLHEIDFDSMTNRYNFVFKCIDEVLIHRVPNYSYT
mgnify:CR=1 FL=1|tara:strand:+ start:802 stop:1005 length:204 start_codon:yes stop_codon:yes gene_type:complete